MILTFHPPYFLHFFKSNSESLKKEKIIVLNFGVSKLKYIFARDSWRLMKDSKSDEKKLKIDNDSGRRIHESKTSLKC